MAKKAPVSKAAQATKIAKTSSKEKKKWSKGKKNDPVKRGVAVDPVLLQRIQKETANSICLTRTSIAEKYNLNAGVAQKILNFFTEQGFIQSVHFTNMIKVYTRVKKSGDDVEVIKAVATN